MTEMDRYKLDALLEFWGDGRAFIETKIKRLDEFKESCTIALVYEGRLSMAVKRCATTPKKRAGAYNLALHFELI